MDENYLDSLLNEVSLDKEIDHKIEEELDNQIQKEKRQYQEQLVVSDEDLFNLDLESDISDIQTDQDLKFSEEQMDVEDLENILVGLFEEDINVLQNASQSERTNIKRLTRIYDYLKWGK